MFIFDEFGWGISGIVFVFIQVCDDQRTKAERKTRRRQAALCLFSLTQSSSLSISL
jgi:hypothetical protein